MEIFHIGFLSVGIIDMLDVFAVTVVFYQVYRIVRGTRATQMFAGLLILLAAGSIAQVVGMSGMTWLIQSIGAVWVIAFVILFQPELRRTLMRIGQIGVLRSLFQTSGERVLLAVTKASMDLSRRRFGGLLVLQRTTGIRGILETGVQLQAEVSADLLVSLFYPRSPLHDGAVIIFGDTIVAARCILPLSTSIIEDESLGTRHRAAIGVTEEVDAVAVVVSEETGAVSIVCNGSFVGRDLDSQTLQAELTKLMYPKITAAKTETVNPPEMEQTAQANPHAGS
ncbi:MAG: TIGR00159 family protein [Calditrichaeota bacterium]|jgi:diadenylate cyclase|nr:TIGR00159 family protein [Calditrichota bacterium]MBT7787871.1 TIGR00159 family protein [Calditrichota bacterium]